MTHDVVTVGNALVDAFMALDQKSPYVRVDSDHHELCFKYGQKIHVQQTDFLLGGNACNVGVGLSRLGFKTGFVAEIGDDDFSQKIVSLLQKESLDLSHLLITKNAASSFAVGINFGGDRTLFIEHVHRKHDIDLTILNTHWVYLTSLGEEWVHVYEQIARQAKTGQFSLAFSPGTHQLEGPHEAVEQALHQAKLLFVNKEEAMLLVKYYLKKDVSDVPSLLRLLHDMGIGVVSITDGGAGSYVISEDGKLYQLDCLETPIVERTGAGDAYASGFLAAMIEEKEVSQAMRFGAVNAASVIGKVGAQTGLLDNQKLEEKVEQEKDFIAKTL